MNTTTTNQSLPFFTSDSEMGRLSRTFNWGATSMGDPAGWPENLKIIISLILNAETPMFLWWGKDFIQFYNDAYLRCLGNSGKHPEALGQKGEDCWPEIWPFLKPVIDKVMSGQKVSLNENQVLSVYKNALLENTHLNFNCSPVKNDSGKVEGIFVVCTPAIKQENFEKLEESENQLRFAIDAAELATWDYNPLTNKFTANDRLKDWFGLPTRSEIELSQAINAIVEKDRDRVAEAIEKALQYESGGVYDIQYTILNNQTKEERIIRAKGKAWFNDEKQVYRFNGILQDETPQVISQKKAEESEQQLRSVIESAPFPIGVYIGQEKRIELANQTMLDTYGKGNNVIGKLYTEILPELDNQEIFEQLDEVYKTGIPFHAKNRRVDIVVDGRLQPYYFNYSFTPLFDAQGKVYGVTNTGANVTDLNVAKNQVEESEQQIRSIIESAPFPIGVYIGPEKRIELANQSMLDTYGKGNNVIGKLYTEILPELDNQEIFEQIDEVYKTGIAFHAKNQRVDIVVDGKLQPFYFNYSFTPLFDAEGKVYGVMNTAANVTDLNVAKTKVEESELFARNIIHNSPVAQIIFQGEEMMVSVVNQKMLQTLGRTASILGKPFVEAIPDLVEPLKDRLVDVFVTGITYEEREEKLELIRYGNPYTGYYNYTCQPLKSITGEIYGIIVTITEITHQVEARRKIEEEKERTNLAIAAGELGVFEIDIHTDDIITNQKLDEIFGLDRSMSRKEYVAAFHPDDIVKRNKAFEDAMKTGIIEYEARLLHKNGIIRWVKTRGYVIYDNGPSKYFGVVQDITEQKLQEQKKDDFISIVSHELRTPLTSMFAYSQVLLERFKKLQDEQSSAILVKMNAQVKRLNFIIQDLLDVTRIEGNKIRFREDDFELGNLVIQIAEEVQRTTETHTIVTNTIENAIVVADRERTSQVITNLLINAIKYSPKGSSVLINTFVKDNEIICSVQDFGTGIAKDRHTKIFERFYQASEVNRYNAGLGLGLYISAEIIKRQGGIIWVESEPGEGATFYFSLPVKK